VARRSHDPTRAIVKHAHILRGDTGLFSTGKLEYCGNHFEKINTTAIRKLMGLMTFHDYESIKFILVFT